MAQSRLHGVSTIFHRLEGMIKVGAVPLNEAPVWFDVYARFPPARPPDQERPLVAKPLKAILYPEDNLRAQFFKTYHNSQMSSLTTTTTSRDDLGGGSGGVGELFFKCFGMIEDLRPDWHEDEVWYVTAKWLERGLGLTLTHRGGTVTRSSIRDLVARVSKIDAIDENAVKTFLETIEREEAEQEEEQEEEEELSELKESSEQPS